MNLLNYIFLLIHQNIAYKQFYSKMETKIHPCTSCLFSLMKETYGNLVATLNELQTVEVINLLVFEGHSYGPSRWVHKYCCFICLWDSRATQQHFLRKDWSKRTY